MINQRRSVHVLVPFIVKHSAPGIVSVCFSLMALRRQLVTRRREQRRVNVKVSTVGVPLGQRQEGREREDLPEPEMMRLLKGAEMDREEGSGVSCYLPLRFCRTP